MQHINSPEEVLHKIRNVTADKNCEAKRCKGIMMKTTALQNQKPFFTIPAPSPLLPFLYFYRPQEQDFVFNNGDYFEDDETLVNEIKKKYPLHAHQITCPTQWQFKSSLSFAADISSMILKDRQNAYPTVKNSIEVILLGNGFSQNAAHSLKNTSTFYFNDVKNLKVNDEYTRSVGELARVLTPLGTSITVLDLAASSGNVLPSVRQNSC